MKRIVCPICACSSTSRVRQDLMPHPYVGCSYCKFYYQTELIPKVYEAFHEASGDTMSEGDKQVNADLALWLTKKYTYEDKAENLRCLDIGSKFPWLSHSLAGLGWTSYAIDGIPEIIKFTKEYNLQVNSAQCDFEVCEAYPWNDVKFNLISLVHVVEHFYEPIKTLSKIFDLLEPNGMLFIRCPDSESPGIERDFTKGHYEIHPQIWCLKAFKIACEKIGFEIEETYTFHGQRDLVLRRRDKDSDSPSTKLSIGAGLIVKNEEDDLPDCLNSIVDVVDVICIVDTGSTDGTRSTIEKWALKNDWKIEENSCPDKVAAKTILLTTYLGASELENGDYKLWNFAKARNQYVKKLDPLVKWLLWMDADDILLNPEKIKEAIEMPYDIFGFGIVNAPKDWSNRFIHHRLWRTGLGVHYSGACHEYPNWSPKVRGYITSDINVQHRWTTHSSQEPGVTRNARILGREYENGKRDNRTLFYYANGLRESQQYEKAVTIYTEYINNPISYPDEYKFAELYLMRCLRVLKRYGEAYTVGFKALGHDQRFSEISCELAYLYEECGLWLKAIAMSYFSLQKVPDSALFIEKNKYTDQPHRIAARCFEKLGDYKSAAEHVKKILELLPQDVDMQKKYAELVGIKELHVSRPGAAGDILVTLLALEEFKQVNEDTKIIYYCAPQHKEIPRLSSAISEVRDIAEAPSTVKHLIGYPRHEGYPDKPMQKHLVHYFGKELGIDIQDDYGFEANFSAPLIIEELKDKKIITFHIKAGWSPYKEWAITKWREFVNRLTSEVQDYILVQIGGETDPALDHQLVLDLRGKLTIVESIQVIKKASLHFGIDSFSNHATALLPHTPAIILWGSTSPIGSGYAHNTNIWLGEKFKCSPCYREYDSMSVDPKGMCPLDPSKSWEETRHPCMQEISVDEVYAAAIKKLKELKI